jgi:hypothetical protein
MDQVIVEEQAQEVVDLALEELASVGGGVGAVDIFG